MAYIYVYKPIPCTRLYMSKINRYNFIKEMYPDYLILLVSKNSYVSFNIDRLLYNYYLDKVFKLDINYIILDGLDIIKRCEFINNKYYYYSKLVLIKEVICK